MVAPKHRIDSDETAQRKLKMLLDAAEQLTNQLTSTTAASA